MLMSIFQSVTFISVFIYHNCSLRSLECTHCTQDAFFFLFCLNIFRYNTFRAVLWGNLISLSGLLDMTLRVPMQDAINYKNQILPRNTEVIIRSNFLWLISLLTPVSSLTLPVCFNNEDKNNGGQPGSDGAHL